MSTQPGSLLLISINCHAEAGGKRRGTKSRLAATGEWLADLFSEVELPASWALPDPAQSPFSRRLLRQTAGHRIGLLADPLWISSSCGRTVYARELARRVESAAAAGVVISSLGLRGIHALPHLDLLVRHRIGVVRASSVVRRRDCPLRRESTRYGIWRAEPTIRWPERTGWLGWNLGGPQRHLVGRLARRQMTHLLLDTASASLSEPQGRTRLRKFLLFVQRQVEAGEMVCVTVERLVAHLRGEQVPRPQRPAPRRVA